MSRLTLVRPRHADVVAGVAPERLGRLRVLHAEGATIYAAHGMELLVSHDGGASFEHLAHAWRDQGERLLSLTPLAARLLRAGIHAVVPKRDGGHVAVVRGALLHRAAGSDRFDVAHRVVRGSRPLNVCAASSGRLFFGEYFGNTTRDEVHVYASDDGRDWDVVHTFSAGTIRHVHGIVQDPYRDGLWVLTGDDGDEAAIWWTDDEFRTLTTVAQGFQGARAVSVLPTPRGVIVPSDAPFEQNWIQLMDPNTGRMERLAPVPGSVFTVGRTRALYLVSTALEPSPVNLDPHVALYASVDAEDWHPITRFARDLSFVDVRRLLQYPMVLLPSGTLDCGALLATGQSIAGLHGRMLRWSEDELVSHLRSLHRDTAAALRRAG